MSGVTSRNADRSTLRSTAWLRKRAGVIAVFLLLFVVWEFGVRALGIKEYLLPPPSTVWSEYLKRHSIVMQGAWVTTQEILLGYALAVLVSIPLALAVVRWRIMEEAVYPVIVFLQIPQTMRAGRLTRSDAILEAVRSRAPRAALAMEILFDLTAIAVVAIILHATWPLFLKSWERNTFVGAVGDFTAPVWPVKLVIMIGAAMLILQFARRAIANLARILGAIDNTPREETP